MVKLKRFKGLTKAIDFTLKKGEEINALLINDTPVVKINEVLRHFSFDESNFNISFDKDSNNLIANFKTIQ